jgi:hypothetical protein
MHVDSESYGFTPLPHAHSWTLARPDPSLGSTLARPDPQAFRVFNPLPDSDPCVGGIPTSNLITLFPASLAKRTCSSSPNLKCFRGKKNKRWQPTLCGGREQHPVCCCSSHVTLVQTPESASIAHLLSRLPTTKVRLRGGDGGAGRLHGRHSSKLTATVATPL